MLKISRFLEYRVCSICGNESLGYELEKINKKDYICINCRECKGYSHRNTTYKGKETETSFSFEFETSSRANELYELNKYSFIGCVDGTIGGLEWKSPIYYNRKSFHNICYKLDKFSKYVGDNCGTHLHVATKYKDIMEEYKEELFQPILNVMRSNPEKTKKFWGRYFGSYCRENIGDIRYNAFNTRSSVETLEFRLLKFRNAQQYIRAADFCIQTTKFINKIMSRDTFDTQDAKKIGQIIAKKYKEVIANV